VISSFVVKREGAVGSVIAKMRVESHNSILLPTRPDSAVSWEARVCFRPGARQHTSPSIADELGAVLSSGPFAIQEHDLFQ